MEKVGEGWRRSEKVAEGRRKVGESWRKLEKVGEDSWRGQLERTSTDARASTSASTGPSCGIRLLATAAARIDYPYESPSLVEIPEESSIQGGSEPLGPWGLTKIEQSE